MSRLVGAALALVLLAGCGPGGCGGGAGRPAPALAGPAGTAAGPRAAALSGKVTRVRDGDSLVVLADGAGVEVRLDGVDAPELAQARGREALRFTAALAFGAAVRLEVKGKDKYDRTLAEVLLPDGRSLNRELVSAGWAWWFRRHSDDRDLERREREARGARRGLWADPDPTPPWEFREAHPRDGRR